MPSPRASRRPRTGRRVGVRPGALLLLFVVLAALLPVPVLEVGAAGRGAALRRPVYPGYRFALRYEHSLFEVPVTEAFEVDLWGRLVLHEVVAPDERIAGYYDIPGARVEVLPGRTRLYGFRFPYRGLAVAATPVGRRTYEDRTCRLPLGAVAGAWGSATLRVRPVPLGLSLYWLGRGTADCATARAP